MDEVLAVGDAALQRKCIGKMEGIAKEIGTSCRESQHVGWAEPGSRGYLLDGDDRRRASARREWPISQKGVGPGTERSWTTVSAGQPGFRCDGSEYVRKMDRREIESRWTRRLSSSSSNGASPARD